MSLVNAPGTIDSGYRGEIKVIVLNQDPREVLRLSRGDRVAQLVVQRVERARFRVVDRLPDSTRGVGGHGSTGGFAGLAGSARTSGSDGTHDDGVGGEGVGSGAARAASTEGVH
jgi:dUTPase